MELSVSTKRGSGERTARQLRSSTPMMRRPWRTGKSSTARRPVSSGMSELAARGSCVASAIHSGSPVCHTVPARPTPGLSATSPGRPFTRKAESMPGADQRSERRNTQAASSTRQKSAQSQLSASPTARSTERSASVVFCASPIARATACSRRSSCSVRFWVVISRPTPR
jgi:hypothetical protein